MKTKIQCALRSSLVALVLAFVSTLSSQLSTYAQGSAFTYQGVLFDNGAPANGSYNLRFTLWDDPNAGTEKFDPYPIVGVAVSNGQFTVVLDFGSGVFTGPRYWMQVETATNGAPTYTALTPRQELTPVPYAIYSEGAGAANSAKSVAPASVSAPQLNTFNAPGDGQVLGCFGGVLIWTNPPSSSGWSLTGNSNTTSLNFLGTTDSNGLELRVNSLRGLRLDYANTLLLPEKTVSVSSINVTAGFWGNTIHFPNRLDSTPVLGGTIAGGGYSDYAFGFGETDYPNSVTDNFGTVGGGYGNTAGLDATVPGGYNNSATGDGSFAAGRNASTTYDGDFVWSSGAPVEGTGSNMFEVFANGGVNLSVGGSGIYVAQSGFVGIGGLYRPQFPLEVEGLFVVDGGGARGGIGAYGNAVVVGSPDQSTTEVSFRQLTSPNTPMHISCSSITILGGADLAEPFEISTPGNEVPQGAVLVIDEEIPGHLKMSDRPYDTRVAGVVSGANGINPGIQMQQQALLEGGRNVALTGRVYVQADASGGPIKPGDLLTTSSTPGHAMKVSDHVRAQGAILGKAMTGLKEGRGLVLVLVSLQ
jgi:hypothetical protein